MRARSHATGWRPPSRSSPRAATARPTSTASSSGRRNFDPTKKYPVIEYIYAGPHDSFVPKTFGHASTGMQAQAELGFIVVQIDGMGTSNRSKAFHDVAGRTSATPASPTASSGTRRRPRSTRTTTSRASGIYGGSAGGQNATGALLFHPEFYKAAVSLRRLPRQSHGQDLVERAVDGLAGRSALRRSRRTSYNAHQLQGKLLLIVGELDENVDPASTMQVAERADQGEQDVRPVRVSRRRHGVGRRGPLAPTATQAVGLLRPPPAGRGAA